MRRLAFPQVWVPWFAITCLAGAFGCPEAASGEGGGKAITNGIGMRLVCVPAGEFQMGSPPGELGRHEDEMRHAVALSRGFFIGVTEVTQREWAAVMGAYNPSKVKGPDLPVTGVKWAEAAQFCEKLSAMEGTRHRLPTEAEWERACRAGGDGPFAGGDADAVAWHAGNSGDAPHPVGKLLPNAWGLHDLHGNVMEWCADWYAERLGRAAAADPAGPPQGEARVARGGSFRHYVRAARAAARAGVPPSYQFDHLGFRVARDAD